VASSTAATAKDALWGSTPISTFMSACTSVWVGPLFRQRGRRTFLLLRDVHIPLLSHSARRAPAGRKPRTSQPALRAAGSSLAIPKTGTLEA
jgi:hypothetical protein